MIRHLPALLVVIPLLSALGVSAFSWLAPRLCLPLAIASLSSSFAASVGILVEVITNGPVLYKMGGWAPPVGIAYVIDYLSAPVLVVVSAVALINILATSQQVERDFSEKKGAFYAIYILFVVGMLGIVVTGDAFNLFVLLEIAALTGYALLGFGHERAPLSSLNYLFIGTIGASFYLLGVGYLYITTGTLNMADLARFMTIPEISSSTVVMFAFIICMSGLFVKMGLFPLHGWLPNAYSHASPASSALIAPLTTKVMIYAMIRVGLYVFTPAYVFDRLQISDAIVWIAVLGIVAASFLALAQRSLFRMLTYIVIAEVGYMVGGFFLGNRMGITGSILHIINDAAMTLCLFLAAGAITFRLKSDSFTDLKGLFHQMPFTMVAFTAGALAVIGVPPTCGFFSKWYLITGGLEAGHYGFAAALIFSSLVNAVLFFRIFEIAYFEKSEKDEGHGHKHKKHKTRIIEAPVSMLVPLMITALSLIILGIYTGDIVTYVIQPAIPEVIA